MAKTKAKRITDIENQIAQLENQRKNLLQQQKRQDFTDRKKRHSKRMGIFERLLAETIQLTDKQFKIFLEQTAVTEHGRRLLPFFFFIPASNEPSQFIDFVPVLARAFGECREGQYPAACGGVVDYT